MNRDARTIGAWQVHQTQTPDAQLAEARDYMAYAMSPEAAHHASWMIPAAQCRIDEAMTRFAGVEAEPTAYEYYRERRIEQAALLRGAVRECAA